MEDDGWKLICLGFNVGNEEVKEFCLLQLHFLSRQISGHACVGCSRLVYLTLEVLHGFSVILFD